MDNRFAVVGEIPRVCDIYVFVDEESLERIKRKRRKASVSSSATNLSVKIYNKADEARINILASTSRSDLDVEPTLTLTSKSKPPSKWDFERHDFDRPLTLEVIFDGILTIQNCSRLGIDKSAFLMKQLELGYVVTGLFLCLDVGVTTCSLFVQGPWMTFGVIKI